MGRSVFVTGGSGYMGSRLIPVLVARGYGVKAVVRAGSEGRIAPGCGVVRGDVLNASTYAAELEPGDTFVQLVGVAHPSPAKAQQFRDVDMRSAMEAIEAAKRAAIGHFIYVSVAHPSPVMRAYVETRQECEAALRASGMRATVLRPFYVLGPGHYWPYALKPFYWMAGKTGRYAESAQRLGLVTIREMLNALVRAVENPAEGFAVMNVPEIRNAVIRPR